MVRTAACMRSCALNELMLTMTCIDGWLPEHQRGQVMI